MLNGFIEFYLLTNNFLGINFVQKWHYMVKRNGTSFLQGIENIQTVQGRTGRLEPGIGKQPEQINPLVGPNH
jgi:hypothetical protein